MGFSQESKEQSDPKSWEVWRKAHELLNSAGVDGGDGLLARIQALIDERDWLENEVDRLTHL